MKLIICGFHPLEELIRKAIDERKEDIKGLIIENIKFTKEINEILKYKNLIRDDDVIICGERSYEVFKKLKIPGQLVPIRLQIIDFIDALTKAQKFDSEVNILNFRKTFFHKEMKILEQLFNLKINQYVYETMDDIKRIFKNLQNEGLNNVIGTGLIQLIAQQKGMNGIVWYGKESIRVVVDTAFEILHARYEEVSNSKRINYIFENFNDGAISISRDGRILDINSKAISLLNLDEDNNLNGKNLIEIFGSTELAEVLLSKREIKGKILNFGKNRLFINSIPIIVDNNFDGLIVVISDIDVIQQNENNIRRKIYSKTNVAQYRFENIIGRSQTVTKTIEKARNFAAADSNVLIQGESGTGKELFAQSIHNESQRYSHPFIAVNCAAIPENLFESEFFGYNEGAFTGAKKGGNPGIFEKAHNGTLFLDELGEIPLRMQAKLLRVLQEKVTMRVGSTDPIPINVRIISATNVDLLQEVKEKRFRMDLYYRLAVLKLSIPPLRNRIDDLELLIQSFTKRNYPQYVNAIFPNLRDIVQLLSTNEWMGNIRELENSLERMFAFFGNSINISRYDVLECLKEAIYEDGLILNNNEIPENNSFQRVIKQAELDEIKDVLIRTNGNKIEAAKILGISRSTLWRKLN